MTTIDQTPFKVNIRLVIGAAIFVISMAGVYFDLKSTIRQAQFVSEENQNILNEIRSERKEAERILNIRLTEIENNHRTSDLRLTILETILNKK